MPCCARELDTRRSRGHIGVRPESEDEAMLEYKEPANFCRCEDCRRAGSKAYLEGTQTGLVWRVLAGSQSWRQAGGPWAREWQGPGVAAA